MELRVINRRQLVLALGLGIASAKSLFAEEQADDLIESESVDWRELAGQGHVFEHWTPEQDSQWEWYRLERYTDEAFESVGISLPLHRETGEAFEPAEGYLRHAQIPAYVLNGDLPALAEELKRQLDLAFFDPEAEPREPDPAIVARDGRPPSEWLTRLPAEDLRMWLKTIEPTQASVSGMTHWVHLVRDHGFDPRRIEGLTEQEFSQLHSAAHAGY